MNRKDFFKKACITGICGCTGIHLFLNSKVYGGEGDNKTQEEDWRIGFIQRRFAKLVDACGNKLDPDARKEIFEQMGKQCSTEYQNKVSKFKNDIEGFAKELEAEWASEVDYNKEKGQIVIYGRKKDQCYCPFVDNSLMSGDFCNCSIGWFKNTFEYLLDKKVHVELISSVLKGGERCTFAIHI